MPLQDTNPLFVTQYVRHADTTVAVVGNATTSTALTAPVTLTNPRFVFILPATDIYIEVANGANPGETTPGSRILPAGFEAVVQVADNDPRIRIRSTGAGATTATIVWAR